MRATPDAAATRHAPQPEAPGGAKRGGEGPAHPARTHPTPDRASGAAPERPGPGVRRFGRTNWLGLWTLIGREVRRFAKVWGQTLLAPLATAALFMAVFHFALAERRGDAMGVPFIDFLAPGIAMMTVIQNAFANTSSSLMIAKIQGSIVDTLMPPLSSAEILTGYALGGVARGAAVGLAVCAPVFLALGIVPAHPFWALLFILLGALAMALAGLIAGVFCTKFDQMAAITNFVVTPLAFLSGTFYSISDLPGLVYGLSHANPVFYLIDGFRYGIIGVSDSPPLLSAGVALASCAALWLWALRLITRGTGLKN